MSKKRYNLMLDEKKTNALDRWLRAAGYSRSGYVNALITKSVDLLKLEKIPDYSKLSVEEVLSMVSGIEKMMKEKKGKRENATL